MCLLRDCGTLINILKMTRTNFYPPLIEVDIETVSATSNNELR